MAQDASLPSAPELRDLVRSALRGVDADYVEVRIEEATGDTIRYRGREVEGIGRHSTLGGCVRALAGGGWGFVSFSSVDELAERTRSAAQQARLVGGDSVRLAPVDPVEAIVHPVLDRDPRDIPLTQKKMLLDEYVETMMGVPGVQSVGLGYGDSRRRVFFATSEGTCVDQERTDVTLGIRATARDGGQVQQAGVSLGSLGDFTVVEGMHAKALEVAELAVALLKAPEAPAGPMTVVLDPVLAGVFIHEAFGHLSEADHVYADRRMQELMVLGRRFGSAHLHVVDGAEVPGLRGSYAYDDEGVPGQRTDLIREGILVGRLHSRETAAQMGELPTGNARAISFRFPPIVRMTNTFISPGTSSVEELISGVREGVYCKNWYGGMTSMEQFTFSAGETYRIRDGRVQELVRPVQLSGNLFSTLGNLDLIADDIDMNQGGGCGKGGQSPLPVSNGSPHIRIQQCLVGGSGHS